MFRQPIACHAQAALIVLARLTIKHEHSIGSSADTCKYMAREKIIYDKANMTKNLILCASELKLYKKGKNSMYWHKK